MRRSKVLLLLSGAALSVSVAGCLETRAGVKEVEEKQVLRKQVATLQQTSAQTSADLNQRFNDFEEDLRKSNGRAESIDGRLTQIKDRAEKNDFALEAKLKEQDMKLLAFREELEKMKQELGETRAALQAAQSALQTIASSASAPTSVGGGKERNQFDLAEAKFEAKTYRDAIFAYEEYRKQFPKGKSIVAATYKIGICFQELGMADDARLFYDEVIAKAPKSKEAERSRSRLKALGKKK